MFLCHGGGFNCIMMGCMVALLPNSKVNSLNPGQGWLLCAGFAYSFRVYVCSLWVLWLTSTIQTHAH